MEKEDFKVREAVKEVDQAGVVSVPNAGIRYLIKRENPVLK